MSAVIRLTAADHKWLLVDVYIDIASIKTGSSRKEFTSLLKDCQSHDLEIMLTKSISRFGRDTVEILDVCAYLHRSRWILLTQIETKVMLPIFTEYLQQLYQETKTGMGQKWLTINVTDDVVLEDVKLLIPI